MSTQKNLHTKRFFLNLTSASNTIYNVLKILFIISSIFILNIKPIFADTIVNAGVVSGVWTAANSPYIVTGNISVQDFETLTIEPGVEVRFDLNTEINIYNDEGLIANGTKDSLIIFTSNSNDPSAGSWGGITMWGTEHRSSFRFCLVEYATRGISCRAWAVGCDDGDNYAEIDSCVIRYCSSHGLYLRGSGSSTNGCTFAKTGSCNPTIQNNLIYENNGDGIYISAWDGYHANGYVGAKIFKNLVFNNGRNGIYCYGDDPIEPKIIGNTIVDNSENGITFHTNFDSLDFVIINNIFKGNNIGINSTQGKIPTYKFNDVWNNENDYNGIVASFDDISADPLFVDAANMDFHLQSNSPCIDAGDPDSPIDPDSTIADIGAFYYHQIMAPIAYFTANPTSGPAPLTVQFTNSSTGDITSNSWDFGDGQTSSLKDPEHIYLNPGNYTVELTVTGPGGNSTKTRANYIEVGDSLKPKILVQPDTLMAYVGNSIFANEPKNELLSNYGSTKFSDLVIKKCNQNLLQKNNPNNMILLKNSVNMSENPDTLTNIFEGALYRFTDEYQTYFEATMLVPAKSCTLSSIRVAFENYDENLQKNKNCEIFVWQDDDGKPGNQIYFKEVNISIEANKAYWFDFQISDTLLLLNGPFWVGHREKTSGAPTSLMDSIATAGTNFYSQSGTEWEEIDFDVLHQAVVSYRDDVKKDEAVVLMNIKNIGEADLSISNISANKSWITDISEESFVLNANEEKYVEIFVDATELDNGLYDGFVTIISNDADNPQYEEPILLLVDKKSPPNILVTPERLVFTKTNDPSTTVTFAQMKIENIGEQVLEVSNILSTLSWVSNISQNNFSLLPAESKLININVTQTQEMLDGEYEGNIEIYSNALDTLYLEPVIFTISTSVNLNGVSEMGIPVNFVLRQNYPNPFNPQTKIIYGIPKLSEVSISIYNLEGQLISTLYKGIKQPGHFSVVWDAQNFPAGTYFVKMKSDNFVETKKCLLIK